MYGKEEILNMPAGREIDALVAEKVMGWKMELLSSKEKVDDDGCLFGGKCEYCKKSIGTSHLADCSHWGHYRIWRKTEERWKNGDPKKSILIDAWKPSTDIAAAWQVVEKFQKEKYLYPQLLWSHSWVFKIWRNNPKGDRDYGWVAEAYANTAPLAICRVALLVMIEE